MHRKQIRRWHKLLSASASLIAILGGVVMAPASANNAPSVDMFWADVSRTNQSTATFYLMTNSAIKNFESSDLMTIGSAIGCKIESSFSPASFHVITVTGCSDGTVAVQLGANSVSDLSGNWGPATGAVSDFTVIDRTAPVFTFEPAPATVAEGTFVLTASIDERADLIGTPMEPTLSGEGCYFAGITYATQSITFAITGCKPAAEVSVTILAKSFVDQTGNYGPGLDLASPMVTVQAAVQALPSPAPTPSATPTASPSATPSPIPTPEATLAVVPVVEPPSPPPAEQPAPTPEPVFEAEQVVPFAPMTSIRAIETSFVSEPVAPRQPRSNAVVTLTEPLPQPKTEVKIEPVPQAASKTIAPATNLSWVMPAASVGSAVLGAVAGALIVRSRLRRNSRLRIA